MPPDVAARILRALDQGRSSYAVFVDADLRIRWVGESSAEPTGIDPGDWIGRYALDWVHPDDVERILHALAHRPSRTPGEAAAGLPLPPLRYRTRRPDGSWHSVEAVVQDLLDDPLVDGLLVTVRPLGGEIDGIDTVIDLLATDAPLGDVLTACARIVPDYLGSAAVVGVVDIDPPPPTEGPASAAVVGADPDSIARRLAADDRWWRPTVEDGKARTARDFADFPDDLADAARAEGFRSAWALPLADAVSGEALGCVVVWLLVSVEPNMATEDGLRQAARLATLVVGEQRRHQALRRAAMTDPLTGLGNRSALRRRLDLAPELVTVALVDLDGFKPVNDAHGHDAGDRVLQVVAERLLAAVREDDCVIRFGGDEFAVVFAEPVPEGGVDGATERVRAAVERPVAVGPGTSVTVGASIGLATAGATEVVRLADFALYEAKRARRPRG